MVGYGAEDNHFVVELTYNYGIGTYALGNDFQVRLIGQSLGKNDYFAVVSTFNSYLAHIHFALSSKMFDLWM